MQAFLDKISMYTGTEYLWVVEVFVVVLLTLVLAVLSSRVVNKWVNVSRKTKNLWDDALFESLSRPVRLMIWLIGLTYASEIALRHSDTNLLDIVTTGRTIGSVAVFAWFLADFISRVEKNMMDPEYAHKPMDPTTALALGKLLRISVYITAFLVVLQTMGYSVSGVLAFGGIGGIAVGFAAKDLLANFFGGLMIYMDRPFAVGDWVRSPDKEIEGTVQDIGWRLTRIITFDKRPLYVPNATFTQISVENPSRMLNRRIKEVIGIRYDDASKMDVIVKKIEAMIRNHPDIDTNQTIIVNFNGFAASSLDILVYCFTKTTDWVTFHHKKQAILLEIVNIVLNEGAEFAFPTRTLHVESTVGQSV